jgi:hypothetical protein
MKGGGRSIVTPETATQKVPPHYQLSKLAFERFRWLCSSMSGNSLETRSLPVLGLPRGRFYFPRIVYSLSSFAFSQKRYTVVVERKGGNLDEYGPQGSQ